MATKEQIELVMNRFMEAQRNPPAQMQRRIDDRDSGMLGVLMLLYRSSETVTAGMVSKNLNITTGRVAVLIRKMVDKGLITKETGANDARVVELRLAERGREVLENLQKQRYEQLGLIIDKVGMERMLEYIEISREIHSVMTPLTIGL